MSQIKFGTQERERMLILKHKFENRITITKHGKESLKMGDYTNALTKFVEYLQIMADVKNLRDFYSLRPSHFDSRKDLTEMMLISHIFFEMARVYDAVPKFTEESKRCLEQFVNFSANQPYQVVNSEMIRKYLKKTNFKNQDAFRDAYQQIYIQSKKCYIVTFCYGADHKLTHDYRFFKDWLLETKLGCELVRIYYMYSSVAVKRWESSRVMHLFALLIIKPILLLFSKTLLRFIIK
jgi:hypothetical protein